MGGIGGEFPAKGLMKNRKKRKKNHGPTRVRKGGVVLQGKKKGNQSIGRGWATRQARGENSDREKKPYKGFLNSKKSETKQGGGPRSVDRDQPLWDVDRPKHRTLFGGRKKDGGQRGKRHP